MPILRYMHFDWWLTLGFLLAAMAGMLAGSAVTKYLSAAVLRRGFAGCVLLLGISVVARNLVILIHTT